MPRRYQKREGYARLSSTRGAPAGNQNAKKVPNPNLAMRKCLGPCQQMFMSEGPGNRMCTKCRGRDDYGM